MIPNVIGFKLEKALQLISGLEGISADSIEVDCTLTPFEDKRSERRSNEPVVVRQVVSEGRIRLTTSVFK